VNGPANYAEADLILTGDPCEYGCPHSGCAHELRMLARALVHAVQALTAAVIAAGAHNLDAATRHEWQMATDPEYAAEQAAEVTR